MREDYEAERYHCSAKWQERNGAIEEVSNILKGAGGHVQPSIGNLLSLLKVWNLTLTQCLQRPHYAHLSSNKRSWCLRQSEAFYKQASGYHR